MRNVDDPYGARLITLDPSYPSNPYILAASLADVDRWPELAMSSSPTISDDEGDASKRPSGFPGAAGLRYSQTIMGPHRSGALGLRVSAKRASISKRHSGVPQQGDSRNLHADNTPDSTMTAKPTDPQADWVQVTEHESSIPDASAKHVDEQNPNEPSAKGVQFIPKFKGAAEMEARRKMRMLARRGPITVETKPLPTIVANINPELSSSDDDEGMLDDDDFEEITETGDDMDDGDEFDP